MTIAQYLLKEAERNFQKEKQALERHSNFIQVAQEKENFTNIDWNCYWSYYHHTGLSAEEALKKSKIS